MYICHRPRRSSFFVSLFAFAESIGRLSLLKGLETIEHLQQSIGRSSLLKDLKTIGHLCICSRHMWIKHFMLDMLENESQTYNAAAVAPFSSIKDWFLHVDVNQLSRRQGQAPGPPRGDPPDTLHLCDAWVGQHPAVAAQHRGKKHRGRKEIFKHVFCTTPKTCDFPTMH